MQDGHSQTPLKEEVGEYRTSTIISRGLYNFYPIIHFGLYSKRLILQTIYVLNKEILLKKSAIYNQERVIMARVRYFKLEFYRLQQAEKSS